MPDPSVDLDELVDLKMLPAWVNEPPPTERFGQHQGEGEHPDRGGGRRDWGRRDRKRKRPTPNLERRTPKSEKPGTTHDRFRGKKRDQGRDDRRHKDPHHRPNRQPRSERPLPPIAVKFLPRAAALENVIKQIKSGTVAYSFFALARLFLEKATRHDVKLAAPPDSSLFRLGESGQISVDRHFLERNAFRFAQADFFKIDVTETEPIKGNFTNVARDRLSGTLLGPTNHHDYQRRLRNLYEHRFSRRISFGDYQHQIQIVTDPAEIEKWKEEARKVTTFTTLREESPQTFSSATDAERHFNQYYLTGLVQSIPEVTITGPESRRMHDRVLSKVIENAWTREMKSPSPMMQELAARFREADLYVFRHRRGVLFVSPVFPRPFRHDEAGVSPQVRTILDAIATAPRIGRKELADKLIGGIANDNAERAKLALASDLLWLINAGYVIELNDGSLDLPRAKTKSKEAVETDVPATELKGESHLTANAGGTQTLSPDEQQAIAAMSAIEKEQRVEAGAPPTDETPGIREKSADVVAAAVPAAEPDKQASAAADTSITEETEIAGS